MRPAVSHKNGTFQAGRTCRIRARGHRKIKAVFPHPGGFSAYMFLHCRAGRNLHSNYTLKLAKCKERYAFFSRIVQNIDFIFRVFHKKRSAFSTKTVGFWNQHRQTAGNGNFLRKNIFHKFSSLVDFLWKTPPPSAEMVFHNVENCAGSTRHFFSTKLWEKFSTLGNADVACRVVD